MKKWIAICLALLIVCSLAACGNYDAAPETTEANAGMAEEYKDLLAAVVQAFPKVSTITEYPLSNMYDGHTSLTELGWALADMDNNGTDELLLKSLESPFIYDAFTLDAGRLVHLFSGNENDSYRLYEAGYVEKQWSKGEWARGTDYFRLEGGELILFDRVVMDVEYAVEQGFVKSVEDADTNQCFFRSTTNDRGDYLQITAMEALNIQQSFVEDNIHLLPVFTPLSDFEG